MKVAIAEGKPVTLNPAATIADGIAVRRAGEKTLPLVQNMSTTSSPSMKRKLRTPFCFLLEREKTLAEGAGAAAIAALVNHKSVHR